VNFGGKSSFEKIIRNFCGKKNRFQVSTFYWDVESYISTALELD